MKRRLGYDASRRGWLDREGIGTWKVRRALRKVLRAAGYDVSRYGNATFAAQRALCLERAKVDVVFDVGANVGQYATKLREYGYEGRLVSFEPMAAEFRALSKSRGSDRLWDVSNVALGGRAGRAEIHVAGNSVSSSMLPMLPRHVASLPKSAYVRSESIRVETLQWALEEYRRGSRWPFLKMDVQGYECEILAGAGPVLQEFVGIQMEMSLIPLYEGETLMPDVVELLRRRGFVLVALEEGFVDEGTGELLQVDGLFLRPCTGERELRGGSGSSPFAR
jgi:FkbM family methyltransferase